MAKSLLGPTSLAASDTLSTEHAECVNKPALPGHKQHKPARARPACLGEMEAWEACPALFHQRSGLDLRLGPSPKVSNPVTQGTKQVLSASFPSSIGVVTIHSLSVHQMLMFGDMLYKTM